jgi:hypothetical protein
MDGLGSAASVIAVIDLTAKVAALCYQYSKAVKRAKSDIEDLQRELMTLETVLKGAQHLIEGQNGASLQTSQRLQDGLRDCTSQLTELKTKLEEKLNAGATHRIMSKFGVRSLKWPFESKEVNGIISTLERYRAAFSTALIIDQTYVAVFFP